MKKKDHNSELQNRICLVQISVWKYPWVMALKRSPEELTDFQDDLQAEE